MCHFVCSWPCPHFFYSVCDRASYIFAAHLTYPVLFTYRRAASTQLWRCPSPSPSPSPGAALCPAPSHLPPISAQRCPARPAPLVPLRPAPPCPTPCLSAPPGVTARSSPRRRRIEEPLPVSTSYPFVFFVSTLL
ncbi:hypothetical protein ABZP36_012446 [Zizania latifolia]